jgi:PIN domain nuclease of toxin-antitoxin system
VSLLLDTHVALSGLAGNPALSKDFLDRLRYDPDIYLSPVTIWEIAIKHARGTLVGPADLPERVRDMGFRELPISGEHAIQAGRLPLLHRDPFDRMLVAQAAVDGMTLATRDPNVLQYGIDTLTP